MPGPAPAEVLVTGSFDVYSRPANRCGYTVVRRERLPARTDRAREAVPAGVAAVLLRQRHEAAREELDELAVAVAPGTVVNLRAGLRRAVARGLVDQADARDHATGVAHRER